MSAIEISHGVTVECPATPGRVSCLVIAAILAAMAFAFCSHVQAQLYAGLELVNGKFDRVGDSNSFIVRKLDSEGIRSSQFDRSNDLNITPVFGYRVKQFGVELGVRRFEWTSSLTAGSGATSLISSDTGAKTPVTDVRFTSAAKTTVDALTVGVTYTPRLGRNGELYTKLGLAYMDVCSHVFEESDAEGRTPRHAESKSGFCRSDGWPDKSRRYESHKLVALGYTHRFGAWAATVYVEAIDDVGSYGTAFVDGGGVGNQTLYSAGLRFGRTFSL